MEHNWTVEETRIVTERYLRALENNEGDWNRITYVAEELNKKCSNISIGSIRMKMQNTQALVDKYIPKLGTWVAPLSEYSILHKKIFLELIGSIKVPGDPIVGDVVYHREYGAGIVAAFTADRKQIVITFESRQSDLNPKGIIFFSYPKVFEVKEITPAPTSSVSHDVKVWCGGNPGKVEKIILSKNPIYTSEKIVVKLYFNEGEKTFYYPESIEEGYVVPKNMTKSQFYKRVAKEVVHEIE